MPVFNIKDSEAHALAAGLARITGETLTTAVKRALRERLAREAYRDFGKGSGHPARLNFGDCFAHALSEASGEQLLFKGVDSLRADADLFR